MTRILIHGAGRMARRVLANVPGFGSIELAGLVSRRRPDDMSESDWFASLEDIRTPPDLLIDFTLPAGARIAAEWCARNGVALVSGTTGLSDDEFGALEKAARQVPVLWAPNLSHGVALLASLVRQTASALDVSANIMISDIHHQHKIDAPSGTALALATAVMEGRSVPLEELLESQRLEAHSEGDEGELAFSSVREGEVIGEHTVSFALADEVIEITHKALDRDVFAKGALKAGQWLVGQGPGYYSTNDWLGLN